MQDKIHRKFTKVFLTISQIEPLQRFSVAR